jgi:hypothetical protein
MFTEPFSWGIPIRVWGLDWAVLFVSWAIISCSDVMTNMPANTAVMPQHNKSYVFHGHIRQFLYIYMLTKMSN